MSTIFGVVLVIVLIASLPFWKHIKPYGYMPVIWASAMLGAHFYSIMSNPQALPFCVKYLPAEIRRMAD